MFLQNRDRVSQNLVEKLDCKLDQILKNQGVLMALIDNVVTQVSKLGTDVSKEIADAQAALAAAIANEADPAEQAKLQSVSNALTGIDSAVTSFDASFGTATGTSSATSTASGA